MKNSLTFAALFAIALMTELPVGLANDPVQPQKKEAGQAAFHPEVFFFATGQSVPEAGYEEKVDRIIVQYQNRGNIQLVITGYTDPAGSDEYNMKLSEARAAQIEKILIGKGFGQDRMMVHSMGETKSKQLTPDRYHTMRKVEVMPIILK